MIIFQYFDLPLFALFLSIFVSECGRQIKDIEIASHVEELREDDVYKLMDSGGLGLRPLKGMNCAMSMKLGWRLIDDKESIWARVVIAKYKCGNDMVPIVKKRVGSSCVWKSICGLWDSVEKGSRVNFWKDRWIPTFPPLIEDMCAQPELRNLDEKVYEYVRKGIWEIDKVIFWFDEDVVRKIAAIPAPRLGIGSDKVVWGLNANGKFSVSLAFRLGKENVNDDNASFWRKIWKWPGPQKFKSFLWLLSKERVFTNLMRFERRMAEDLFCPSCRVHSVSALHAVRDCEEVKPLWLMLIKPGCWQEFFNCNMRKWIEMNLSRDFGRDESGSWRITFVVCAWRIWWRRNKFVFEGLKENRSHIFWDILLRSRKISDVWKKVEAAGGRKESKKVDIFVGWKPPDGMD
ncbi:putative ribonuclease H protein At1g65750 family [Senna tora]|uniref:Putative ribonuclease H protein At1g65750 family n=1 Tax=Senna tora TaxID=362788 RepID=A0A834WVV7_9FABA|nr:putative ribonuclease H protein At1g65750 family [Senna tora]